MDCCTPGLLFIASSQSLLKLMSIELVMPSNHLILCHPLLLLPSIFIYVCIYIHIYIYILLNHLAVHMKHCGSTIFQVEKAEHYLVPIMWIGREKAMAPHSSTLAWKLPWTEEPGRLQSMGLRRVGHDWTTSLSLFTFMHWRRKWQPTPVFLPGESQGQGSLVGCRLWVAQSWTWLKRLSSSSMWIGHCAEHQ